MSLEAKIFLDNKQEEHFKQFGVYADVTSKLAEWMQEYAYKQNGFKQYRELLVEYEEFTSYKILGKKKTRTSKKMVNDFLNDNKNKQL